MTDEALSANVKQAADSLARAMNAAGKAGLRIELEMKPHNRDEDAEGVKIYGFIPRLSVTRTIRL